ncbi:MAG TPA: hypothetical protein VFE17_10935 [Candidatus Baltobacteraceae bacterium]|nr:hypothetical protein [Candidatus Baltobacteraceae bacterium]
MITVVTATGLEYSAARRALPAEIRVIRAGLALKHNAERIEGSAISCGVAGGLRADLPTGTVLIPRFVMRPDGTRLECDSELVQALCASAAQLGHRAVDAPLMTSESIVHGAARDDLAKAGYAGVDMETGWIQAERVACVRVILDTPHNEISRAWEHPATVFFKPKAWGDLPFLAREGPRCARIAAAIAARALDKSAVR